MKAAALGAVSVLALSASVSRAAEEPRRPRWEVDLRASFLLLGARGETGGWQPSLAARRTWPVGEIWEAHAGAQLAAFGLVQATGRSVGVLGGASGGASVGPWESLRASFSLALDAGRIPVRDGYFTLQWLVLTPAASLEISREAAGAVSMFASGGVRWVRTPGWSGWPATFSAGGRLRW